MKSSDESVSERQSGAALKKVSDVGTDIEAVVPEPPGLQGGSRHAQFFGDLTLGEPLGSQLPVRLKEVCAFETIPAGLASRVDWWHVLDDGSHCDLLCQSFVYW